MLLKILGGVLYCIVLYCIGKLIYQSPEVMLHKYTFVGPIQALSETRRMTIFDIEPLRISQIPYRPVWKDRLRDNQSHQVSYLPVFVISKQMGPSYLKIDPVDRASESWSSYPTRVYPHFPPN